VALNTSLTSVSALPDGAGWELTTLDAATGEESTITAATLVNAAGLGACEVNNMVLPKERHRKAYYAKGSYFSYSGAAPASRLIYPAPEPDLAGLGTHLTLDMAGQARFGPDVEWVSSPDDLDVDEGRKPGAAKAIREFVPGIEEGRLGGDYAGMRAKLGGKEEGFQDFVVRREEGCEGFVNLLGIESPGLTSSLAIAEMVVRLVYKEE
jgi:2-hydroxyglutarate dehydrogenase